MRLKRKSAVFLIDLFYFLIRKMFSKSRMEKIYQYICKIFEEEAVDCYMRDIKDIGFFEIMILGSDETKEMSRETTETMEKIKRTEFMEKLVGYVPSSHIRRSQETEVVWGNIEAKKKRVVEVLTVKGELIKYLGRRIVSRDEKLYERIERVYSNLEIDLNKILPD